LGAVRPRRDGSPVERRHGAVARLRDTTATSAGGIVVRIEDDIPYLVVGSRPRAPPPHSAGASGVRIASFLPPRAVGSRARHRDIVTWTLPKGTPNPGETREATALREVAEETGLEVRITGPLDSIEYVFIQRGVRIHKTVHYYFMEPIGGDLAGHDHEFEEVRWISFDDAAQLLTFETERALVQRARAEMAAEPAVDGAAKRATASPGA
jgi:8-oxo-dGTP pyrophosphatase MutT (NUDIX family)